MKKLCSIISFVILFLFGTQHVSASVPYVTETLSPQNEFIITQTAYNPVGLFANEQIFENIEDIVIDSDGFIYIVDSSLHKVMKFDKNGKLVQAFGENLLKKPLGIFVTANNELFVADYDLEQVVAFNQKGEVVKAYGTPDSPLFGKNTKFKPQKVSVDKRGNIYVVSEGSTNGIIQLNHEGGFLGFYGSNSTEQSFFGAIQEKLFPNSSKANKFAKLPPAPSNITIDNQGLIYSLTKGSSNDSIKKLNVAGTNMLPEDMLSLTIFEDLTVDNNGNMIAIAGNGSVVTYDSTGNLLFVFGGKDDGTNRLGLFKQASTIAVDDENRLYVGDRENGKVTIFEITNFGEQVLLGINGLKEGFYQESQGYWEEVLRLNESFGLAHTAMGKSYFKQEAYKASLDEFKLASDKEGYSDAFWQIRYEWMLENLDIVLYALLVLVITYSLIRYIDRKKGILNPLRQFGRKLKDIKLVRELLFMFYFLKKPMDGFYELKRKNRASMLAATILYIVFYLEVLYVQLGSGYIFRVDAESFNFVMTTGSIVGIIALFIVMNYLVSTIKDGEGKLSQLYMGVAYSLAPFILFSIPIVMISNVLTFNEAFVYDFALQVVIVWCGVILFMMIKELHNYSISESIRNILTTLFASLVTVLVVLVMFVLSKQVLDFVYSIVQEVMIRV